MLSAPGCAGVKRGSSFDRTESGPLGRQISGAGPTMEEAVANALRLQARATAAASTQVTDRV